MLNRLGENKEHDTNDHCRAEGREIAADAHLLIQLFAQDIQLGFQFFDFFVFFHLKLRARF